jgi:hypothetical protein
LMVREKGKKKKRKKQQKRKKPLSEGPVWQLSPIIPGLLGLI